MFAKLAEAVVTSVSDGNNGKKIIMANFNSKEILVVVGVPDDIGKGDTIKLAYAGITNNGVVMMPVCRYVLIKHKEESK